MNHQIISFLELPTEILKPLEDCTVSENENGKFHCAFSKPNLRVKWKRNNRDITHSEKYIMRVEGENHYLEVLSAELKDEADYSCDTVEVKTTAKLFVKGKSKQQVPAFRDYDANNHH